MEIKKILSFIALIAGVILLITGFIIWGVYLPTEVLILNIIVATIIYALLFVDVLLPWVQWSDPSQRSIGILGLRWTLTVIYAVVAILLMVVCLAAICSRSTMGVAHFSFRKFLFFLCKSSPSTPTRGAK